MRILFISNYYPGDLGPLARALGASPENEVLFASNRQRREFSLPGVRRVRLKNCPALFGDGAPAVARIWEEGVRRGAAGLRSLETLRETWGAPDIVLASLAAGAAFFAPQVFPGAFFVAYAESGLKNHSLQPREVREAWALMQGTLFLQAGLCFAFSEAERERFPGPLQGVIRLVPPCVDTDIFSRAAARPWLEGGGGLPVAPDAPDAPVAGADAPLLTLNATGLEGRALAALLSLAGTVLRALPVCRAVMLTENGSRREALEAAARVWPEPLRERFAVYDALPFTRYRDLLAASSLVVCPGGGDAARRAMLEAMSCEALLMARADAAGFLRPGVNMAELPGRGAAEAVLTLLRGAPPGCAGAPGASPMGVMARRTVLEAFSEATVVPRHLAEVMGAWRAARRPRARA